MTTPSRRLALHAALDAALNRGATVSIVAHPKYEGDDAAILNAATKADPGIDFVADQLPGNRWFQSLQYHGNSYNTEITVFSAGTKPPRQPAPERHAPRHEERKHEREATLPGKGGDKVTGGKVTKRHDRWLPTEDLPPDARLTDPGSYDVV